MSFLIPTFLIGGLLIGLPFLIHHIRRPEREPERFSSLMFVPKVKKEVIERRKLQHILLMLLRMLMILLLAWAFARPFLDQHEQLLQTQKVPAWHVVLLDVSHSMTYGDTFEQARRTALRVIGEVPDDAYVGVITFAGSPRLVSGFDEEDVAAARARSRDAIERAQVTQEVTNYVSALLLAEDELLARLTDSDAQEACVLHLVSDFRRGQPEATTTNWRLSGRIRLIGHQVGMLQDGNFSLTDVAVRHHDDGRITVAGRVKNWYNHEQPRTVTLALEGREPITRSITLNSGGASTVSFLLEDESPTAVIGEMYLEPDAFNGDNRRYLLWRRPPKHPLWLVGDPTSFKRYGSAWFTEAALSSSKDSPWQLSTHTPADLLLLEQERPTSIILCGADSIDADQGRKLADYVDQGGKLLLTAGETVDPSQLNRRLLHPLGLHSSGMRYRQTEPRGEPVVWVNFDSPVFQIFRNALYNDFSSFRFDNYHLLSGFENSNPQSLLRGNNTEGTQHDLMLDHRKGKGHVLVWAFEANLDWSNLPKHPKYLPLLRESLKYLSGHTEPKTELLVGQRLPRSETEKRLQLPDGTISEPGTTLAGLRNAGFVSSKPAESEDWQPLYAVNIDASEGNPETMTARELTLKLASNSTDPNQERDSSGNPLASDVTRRIEIGHAFMYPLFLILLFESFYAVRLSKRRQRLAGGTP